jgi:predicted MFS family arabinose efflux permease
MIGYSTGATYVGLTAGPVIGGLLNSTLGWRSVFAASVIVSAIAFTAAVHAPNDTASPSGEHRSFDTSGLLLYIFAIGASLYGLTDLGKGLIPVVFLIAGIAAIVLFFIHEGRQADPIMKVSMFSRSRTFTFSSLAALLNYGATFAISYTLSIYLQIIKGFPSSKAGLLLIAMPALQALFSPLMGSLSDRVRPSVLASTGMGICAFTLLLFSRLNTDTSLAYVLTALGLTGFGFALFSSPNTNAILSSVDKADYAVANSIVATMRTYGQSSSMAIISVVTAAVLGTASLEASPAADIIRMMHAAFMIFALLCVIGIFFSLMRDSGK